MDNNNDTSPGSTSGDPLNPPVVPAELRDVMDEATGITPRQEQAIAALLTEPTIVRAAQAVEVSERTLYRWLSDPVFKAAYLKARRDVFGQAVGLAQRYAPLAVNALARTVSDPVAPWAAKIAAAVAILRFGREGVELDDLVLRVSALEARSEADGAEQDRRQQGGDP